MVRRLRLAVGLAVITGLLGGTVLPAQAATPWAVTSAATGSGTYSQSFSILPNHQWSITGSFAGLQTLSGTPVIGTFDLELTEPWFDPTCSGTRGGGGGGTISIVSNVGSFQDGVICNPGGGLLGVGPPDLTVRSDPCWRCSYYTVYAHLTLIQGSFSPPPTPDGTSTAPLIAVGTLSFSPVPVIP
jgi:hypothetical protein